MPGVDVVGNQHLPRTGRETLDVKPFDMLTAMSASKGRDAWGKWGLTAGAAAPLLMLAAACATAHPEGSFPAQKALLGKTESEVLACVGEPNTKSASGDETTLTYHRRAPVLEKSFAASKTSVACPRHSCEAVVVLKDGRVAEVQYRPTPSSIGGCEHCEEIFRECMP